MIYCFGSINQDIFYWVPHVPASGETISAARRSVGLGGKGANQSVALAKAGCDVKHLGSVGPGGEELIEKLNGFGVDTSGIATQEMATGHAIITVGDDGDNAITLFEGANTNHRKDWLQEALSDLASFDFLVLQNETNLVSNAAEIAKARGATVVYSAAPFEISAVEAILPHVDILAVNEIEAAQLSASMGLEIPEIPVPMILVTKGANGSSVFQSSDEVFVESPKVDAVDTTAAGDTFLGYFVAGLSKGHPVKEAMTLAAQAAALKVTKKGTADAIPSIKEVSSFFG